MKRKTSIILFGISFIIAILGEAYLLNEAQPYIFSIVGIGLVVILTGYLFFDSVWEYVSYFYRERQLLWEESQRQDREIWDTKYEELLNIQKATYAALKKSDIKRQEEIEKLSDSLNQIIQLQSKAMEGQRKALNISLNNSKELTKELIEVIKVEYRDIRHQEEKVESEIIPLYDDPNATLTSDEIAELFNRHGN